VRLPEHTAQSGPRSSPQAAPSPCQRSSAHSSSTASPWQTTATGLCTVCGRRRRRRPSACATRSRLPRSPADPRGPRTRRSGEDVREVEGPSRPPGAPAPSPAALRHVSARARDPVDRAVGPDERSVGIVSRRVIVEGARREKRTPAHALTESSSSRSRAPPQTTDLNTGHAATPGVTTAPLGKRASPMSRSSRSLRTTRSCWRRRPDHARFRRRLRRGRRCTDGHREPVGRPRH
jgi:hypothetical protein